MSDSVTELDGFLAGITVGKQVKPILCLIHGLDGVGKTLWASKAPNPIFIGTEKGSDQLDVARLPRPETLGVFLDQLSGLANQTHPFKTIVIDSIDWLEPLIWLQTCREGQVKTIEDYAGGFGKGYIRALEIWRGILERLVKLAERYHVILIAHSKIKKFDDPQLPSGYDRYVIAINEGAAATVRQAVDTVLFANFKEKVRQVSKYTGKGLGEGERALYTEHRPAFDAKNRFQLPFELPLEWKAFAEKVKEFYFGQPQSANLGAEPSVVERSEPEPSVAKHSIANRSDGAAAPAAESAPSLKEESKDALERETESVDRPAPVAV